MCMGKETEMYGGKVRWNEALEGKDGIVKFYTPSQKI